MVKTILGWPDNKLVHELLKIPYPVKIVLLNDFRNIIESAFERRKSEGIIFSYPDDIVTFQYYHSIL